MSEIISPSKQNLWEFPYGIWLPKHDPKLIDKIKNYIKIIIEPDGYHMMYFNGYRVRTPRESGSHPCYNCGHCIDNGISACGNRKCMKDRKDRKLCDNNHGFGDRGKAWIHDIDKDVILKNEKKGVVYHWTRCKECNLTLKWLGYYPQEHHIREYYKQEQFPLRSMDVVNNEILQNKFKVPKSMKIKTSRMSRGAYGELRHLVYQYDNYKCRECGASKEEIRLEIDHIIPWSKGGKTELGNLQTLCRNCNHSKHTRTWVGGQ